MKKFCAILFSFVLVLMLALPVAAEDAAGESDSLFDTAPALTAPAGYVVNLDTNIVVYEKNSETQLSAASLTKMMTTLLLLENYQDQLDSISLTAPSYIYDLIWEQSTNASTADIRRGETQSLRNLLYAMLLPSGNEAAYIVADYMGGGSIDNFVAMMNDEAKAVGCTGTTFVDPCGLNPNNITTARDAYLILRALTAYDVFATVIATPSYDMGTNDRYTTPGTSGGLLLSCVNGFSAGVGFGLALILFCGVRKALEHAKPPKCFEGLPITLVAAALTSMTFMGFAGMADKLFG